jgi:hypothetical protein
MDAGRVRPGHARVELQGGLREGVLLVHPRSTRAAVGVPDVSHFQPDAHRTRPAWLAEGLLELKAGEPLPEWNDAPGRTIEQVLGLLDAVAADLDKLRVAA